MNDPKLELIFHAAKELSSLEQRDIYLRDACRDRPELRNQVDELLRAAAEADALLQTEIQTPETQLTDTELAEGPGSRIARYKLLQRVGEGGMGVVYMAEQTEPVKRKVALKIIKLGMDTRQVVARFEAERQALAMMDHPNIAKVFDAGATETGRPYFVMELVRGVPITEYCDKNKLGTPQRLELFKDVCRAIQHAHQKGVIHRDIKPSNVMVTLHDGDPVPKVIDFGIAKATNHNLTEKTLFTNYSQMIGTPAYMSPEQAEMSGLDVDTRTDVYSLGVLLYELLTGTTPFPSKELLSLGYGEMQRVITEDEPPKPSTRLSTMQNEEKTVAAKNRAIPEAQFGAFLKGDLDWIVMKSLEKDRTQRYETVNALATDVTRFLSDEPVSAAAPTLTYQLSKLYRRNRRVVQTAFATGVILLLATVISSVSAIRAKELNDVANSALRQEAAARTEAEQLRKLETIAKAETQDQLRLSLVGQAEAWLASRSTGYQTNVLDALRIARDLPGAEADLTKMRSLAWGALSEPFKPLWENRNNAIPKGGDLTAIAHSSDSFAFGYRDGGIKIVAIKTGQTTDVGTPNGHSIVALTYHDTSKAWIACDSQGLISIWFPGLEGPSEAKEHRVEFSHEDFEFELLPSNEGFILFSFNRSVVWRWNSLTDQQPDEVQLSTSINERVIKRQPNPVDLLTMPPVAIHPDGRHLALYQLGDTGEYQHLAIWDLEQKKRIKKLFDDSKISADLPCGLAFSSNGRILATLIRTRVWIFTSGDWIQQSTHRGVSGTVTRQAALSPNGNQLAIGGTGLVIETVSTEDKIFHALNDGGMPVFNVPNNEILSLRVIRENMREKGRLVWEVTSRRHASSPVFSNYTPPSAPTGFSFSPTSDAVAITGWNFGEVRTLGTANDQPLNLNLSNPETRSEFYEDPAFSPDGNFISALYRFKKDHAHIQFWNAHTGDIAKSIDFGTKPGLTCFSSSHPLFAAVAGKVLGVWSYHSHNSEKSDQAILQLAPLYQKELQQEASWVAFHPSLKHIFWTEGKRGKTQPTLQILDLESGERLPFKRNITEPFNSVVVLPEGTQIVIAAELVIDGQRQLEIQIWDYLSGKRIGPIIDGWELSNSSWGFSGLSVSPNGRFLTYATHQRQLKILDLTLNAELATIEPSDDDTFWLSQWSPDGNHLATLGNSGQVHVWHINEIRQRLGELRLDWKD